MEVFGSNGIIAGGIETALGTNRLGVTSEGGGTEKFGSAGGGASHRFLGEKLEI